MCAIWIAPRRVSVPRSMVLKRSEAKRPGSLICKESLLGVEMLRF